MKGTLNVPSVYVILRRKGKVLFIMREHTGFMDGTFALPSGHVEPKENFLAAAARETKEEVGVTVRQEDFKLRYTMHRYAASDIRLDLFFEATKWTGEPINNEPHKHSGLAWFTEAELSKQPIMDYQGFVLQDIAKGKTYSEWGWDAHKSV